MTLKPQSLDASIVEEEPTSVGVKVAPSVGRYQFIAELGQGGMATVYLAVHRGPLNVRKLAVVKLMRSDVTEDSDFVEMFFEEARLACKLNHPNIVNTYEVGEEEKKHYIAMEYLEGVSLQQWINRLGYRKLFRFVDHVRVLIEVLKGLQYAHEAKDFDGTPLELVHRDISPHNILITYDGQVKILDFGIAKAADSRVETRVGVIKGKVTYMAPEQAFMGVVDGRADVYAVGVMLWEAASCRRRWKGVPASAVLTKLRGPEALMDPIMDDPVLAARVKEITDRAMHPELSERYLRASDMRHDLEALLRELKEDVSTMDIGARLSDAFDEERSARAKGIQKQIRALDAAEKNGAKFEVAVEPPPPSAVASTFGTGSSRVRVQEHADGGAGEDGTQVSGASNDVPRAPATPSFENTAASRDTNAQMVSTATGAFNAQPKARPIGVYVAAALIAAVGIGFAAWPRTPVVAAAPVESAPVLTSPSTSEKKVALVIDTEPAGAAIVINGAALAPGTHRAEYPPGTWVVAKLTYPGFQPEERQMSLASDTHLVIALKPELQAKPEPARPVRTGTKAAPAAAATPPAPVQAAPPDVAPAAPAKPSRPVREIEKDNPLQH